VRPRESALLLIGVTGFIGKVWLVDLLENIPKIGKITLLIRRNRTTSALRRFEKIVENLPPSTRSRSAMAGSSAHFCEKKWSR